jgi:hypothetical protein
MRMMLVAYWFTLMPLLMAQQTTTAPKGPTSSAVVRSYSAGTNNSSRETQTRTTSPGREVVTQTIEQQALDGRFQKVREATTETVGVGSKSVQSTQTVYSTDADGRRVLIQQTKGDQQVLPDGTTQTVQDIFDADLNGRLGLSQREVSAEKTLSKGVSQTDTSLYRPGLNEPLQEAERLREIERQVSPNVVQTESTRAVRSANGQFQTVETRNHEIRKTGATGSTEEETINRADTNGVLNPFERNVSRASSANGREEVVRESYTQAPNQPAGRLELKERTRIVTTKTADGGSQTVRELERANPVPNGQLRVVERTVETVRSVGPDQWATERQVFSLDTNGRLVPSITDRGQSVGK